MARTALARTVLLGAGLPALLGGCSFVGATAQVGFASMSFQGDAALASATGGVPSSSFQDVDEELGVGSMAVGPFLRGQVDLGSLVATGSTTVFEQDGGGTISSTWGPIAAGSQVRTSFEFHNTKLSLTYDIDLGLVKVSPGIGLDVIDFNLTATETTFGNQGQIDELLPLPMALVRAEGGIGIVDFVGEVGILSIPEIDGAEVDLLDIEALVEVSMLPTLHLFAGYRLLDIDGKGETSDTSFAIDGLIDGWVIGGGFRF